MMPLFHITRNKNVERIRAEGLKPGADLGLEVQDYYGAVCDNRFVYLSKTPDALNRWFANLKKEDYSLVTLHLPEDQPLERDLDVHVVIKGQGNFFGYCQLKEIMKELSVSLPEEGLVDIVGDANAIKSLLSIASDRDWDRTFGFYRTPIAIPPTVISSVERCDINGVLNREYLLDLIAKGFKSEKGKRHVLTFAY